MRRLVLWLTRILVGLVLLLTGLLLFLNTAPGLRLIERVTPLLSEGEAAISGLSGRFPDRLRVARIELIDPAGVWGHLDDVALDWSARHLFQGRADIDRLTVGHIVMQRVPEYPEDPEEDNSLPLFFAFRELSVARCDLAATVAGAPMSLRITGSGDLSALDRGSADLQIERTDAPGSYRLVGAVSPDGTQLQAIVNEPPQGLLAGLAGLPDLGSIQARASMEGPWSDSRIVLNLKAGPLRAEAGGAIDWSASTARVTIKLTAPAMKPRPDLSWQSVQVTAHIDGPFAGPKANGSAQIGQLTAGGATVRSLTADLRGDAERVQVQAEASGVRLPGPSPGLLENHPLTLSASADLRAKNRPIAFKLRHPLLGVDGTAVTVGKRQVEGNLALPALAPVLAGFGVDLQGTAALDFRVTEQQNGLQIDVNGKLATKTGAAPLPALIGPAATFRAAAQIRGTEVTLPQFQFDGKALSLAADGSASPQAVALKYKLALLDLKALSPELRGRLNVDGALTGPPAALALDATLAGDVSARGIPSGPLNAKLKVTGLPGQPSGTLTAQGSLENAPLSLSVAATPVFGGEVSVRIDKLDWKSLHATGALSLQPGSVVPIGKVEARVGRMEDLRRLARAPLTGTLTVTLDTSRGDRAMQARLNAEGHDIGIEGTAVAAALSLQATAQDPLVHPVFSGQLALKGLRTGTVEGGSLRIDASGPAEALATRLQAELPGVRGAPAALTATLVLDAMQRELELSALQATWRQEVLRLRRPAHLGFGDTLAVSRLSLAWRQASLDVDGRVSPDLDLTAELRDVPADALALIDPDYALDGRLQASARLNGPPAQPRGSVRVDVTGVQGRSGAARGLPALNFSANALLDGEIARLDGRLTGGPNAQITLRGDVPLRPSQPLNLQADGAVDLKLLDPLLMAEGRRARGRIALNAGLRGTLGEPAITGGFQLSQGEFEDYAIGLRLSDLTASVQSDGDRLRIDRLEAHAGPGRIDMRGSIGVLQAELPIDLTLTARNARPLSSDRMTVTLDSNLTLHGDAHQRLAAAGNIHIRRAEIRIPEHIPATIAVLDVRVPGAPPPPPPAAGPDIGVDLTIDATDEIFVRGRGLDAEMYGKIHLLGTANAPQPNGRFAMRRGQFTLMGKTLTFSRGEVGFDGGTLTNPTLDFVANATNNNITATLAVGGTARKPKITLTSVPELPQDEILAQLLFGRGSAALSPLELAQIAGALASLTGVTSGLTNPLETVRKGLGLDRLAVGSTKAGAPTLEAGRYVAPGVYLGAKQGFSGGSAIPQAAVQIDVTEGLKLEGTVGAGNNNATATSTGASSAGVLYQFEY
ncbi:translocation/assembly module TamB domain-containing protein [Methylotetracoccus oryzae]|uniref:translocation/assembly module TamB domain-containing protein n=1 Tax=Methylotetracoccus oryzae TaxID=1919059 RepID=UPI00111A24C7|nr:translocation/assembly module TamB domain-containing protein [Methylotetracoccus oryzae]